MPELIWDKVGDRKYKAGVDHGVLYLPGGAVPWNGLTGVEEGSSTENKPFYQDGIKYLDHQVIGEFVGKVKAFTYPKEFEQCIGVSSKGNGLRIHDQQAKSFGMSYRTLLGNDVNGLDLGYEIHLLYNLRAVSDTQTYTSLGAQVAPLEFSWGLNSTPTLVAGYRPTAHVSLRSTDFEFAALSFIEGLLYGSDVEQAYLPTLGELVEIIETPLIIVDNGNGTWSATGSSRAVVLLSDTAFQISGIDATYLDAVTYQIQTTPT